ncbi:MULTISPECIES: glycosyltransferase [unclassified Paludibacterium]|uniref:glycosyltransferase n=1 Tax=unclassified Paludibacterium TaxID=2618429 RepID=UPI001C044F9F|nr:glycosyltransferase [Paludibacterium sp. B53371]BEV73156.1 hypothetical protein THUN1379_26380 [Paludibacterium sp. THUN1379]
MTRLRIAHLIDLDRIGGVESMYASLIQAPVPEGWQVEHHTIADSLNLAPRFRPIVERCSRTLVSPKVWHGIKLPRRPAGLRARNRLAQIRAIRPDVVLAWNQFTDFHLSPDLGCPLIYYEHGMSWYEHAPAQLQGFLPYVDGAIAVSRAGQRMLQLKHGVSFPVHLCPNPLRADLHVTDAPVRCLPQDRPLRLGVAARLVPLKAVGLVVLALKLLRQQGVDAELSIAGEGPERGAIERLIAREGLADHVRLLGLCDDMAGFYRSIDLFVMSSMHETMPLVCIESMAYGVPVIACMVDGLPEVVRDGQTGRCLTPTLDVSGYQALTGASVAFARRVYDPQQDLLVETRMLAPEAIAEAVTALASEPAGYQAMSAACLVEAALPRYDQAQYLQQFYGLLADFATKR